MYYIEGLSKDFLVCQSFTVCRVRDGRKVQVRTELFLIIPFLSFFPFFFLFLFGKRHRVFALCLLLCEKKEKNSCILIENVIKLFFSEEKYVIIKKYPIRGINKVVW